MRLYRSMREDPDGLPTVGPSGRTLGVRPGSQLIPDVVAVHPTDMVLTGLGGMSVTPNVPQNLPRHRRPPSLGGTGREPVWYIDDKDLGPQLSFRQDRPTHGLIEPDGPVELQHFQAALASTRPYWRLYCR
jgi:hypothetical protein